VLRLVSDENFNADILRGLYRRRPDLDVVRVQDVGLSATPDPEVLAWAAGEGRILLTLAAPLPHAVASGAEPFFVVGALPGG
jgi:hypothetical protein